MNMLYQTIDTFNTIYIRVFRHAHDTLFFDFKNSSFRQQ